MATEEMHRFPLSRYMFCLPITREDGAHTEEVITEAPKSAQLSLLLLLLHGDGTLLIVSDNGPHPHPLVSHGDRTLGFGGFCLFVPLMSSYNLFNRLLFPNVWYLQF